MNVSLVRAKAVGYYINSILANQEALTDGYDEALLLDTDGYVSEGSGENVFIVKNGKLYTPDLASCLDGITRDAVLTMARDLGIAVIEKRITRDEIYAATKRSSPAPPRKSRRSANSTTARSAPAIAARSPKSCSRCSSTWSPARRRNTSTG